MARLTLALGGFMLVLLISLPFSLGDDAMSGTAPYILYSLFLTSIGIVIGVSLTWLNDPSRLPQAQSEANPTQAPMLSADESAVLEALRANGSMWQKELVESCGFTDSKASRVLSRMERAVEKAGWRDIALRCREHCAELEKTMPASWTGKTRS